MGKVAKARAAGEKQPGRAAGKALEGSHADEQITPSFQAKPIELKNERVNVNVSHFVHGNCHYQNL